MKNNESRQKLLRPAILILILVIVAVVIIVLQLKKTEKSGKTPTDTTPTASNPQTFTGELALTSVSGLTIIPVGEEVSLFLTANSDGKEFGGYDVVLNFPKQQLQYVRAVSLLDIFELRVIDEDTFSLTGVVDFTSSVKGYTAAGEPIAEVTFKGVRAGRVPVEFEFEKGATHDSNIVIASPPSDILGSAKGLTLFVVDPSQADKLLTQTQPLLIDGGTVIVTLERITTHKQGTCFDCVTSADLVIKKGNQTEKVSLQLGGIEGKRSDSAEGAGYIFETTDISETGVVLRYAAGPN